MKYKTNILQLAARSHISQTLSSGWKNWQRKHDNKLSRIAYKTNNLEQLRYLNEQRIMRLERKHLLCPE